MERLELQLKLLSPAFVAGADQRLAELRAASVKGLLRWWWRAACGDAGLRPKELLEREGRIFGVAGERASWKSPFSCELVLKASGAKVIKRGSLGPRSSSFYEWHKKGQTGRAQALHYVGYAVVRIPTKAEREEALAGKDQELLDPKTKKPFTTPVYIRPAYAEGTHFTLRLSWQKRKLPNPERDELFRALSAWIVFGGLGSRSRKGFGALAPVVPIPDALVPFLGEMQERLRVAAGATIPANLPAFPSLGSLVVLASFSSQNWRDALGQAAIAYRAIRPKGGERWIAGSAAPRRASSVFVTLTEDQSGDVRSWLYALPCRKSSVPGVATDHKDWENFLRFARAQLGSILA